MVEYDKVGEIYRRRKDNYAWVWIVIGIFVLIAIAG